MVILSIKLLFTLTYCSESRLVINNCESLLLLFNGTICSICDNESPKICASIMPQYITA